MIARPGGRAVQIGIAAFAVVAWIAWATLFRLPPIEVRYPMTVDEIALDVCRD